ncbi:MULTISPECIES: biotin/lipoyl-containing protein [Pseudoalteromonas]|uniref:biotin/lipoyl-containing protein n=1 Tax=Pseudoalteromonas TaxID=53246 RepID=UPI0011083542|nr:MULTISPECIES: biotin/lipoyl-containing protein [Pseudoalteromonas]MCG9758137.1 dihydrolipoyltranssuccinate transferase [Pseudoalteromonas sp. Isolate6]NKC18814.1 dihydrolipoyltranssuccinate transferase [Pseudoalteromonas galatheae]
MAIELKVPVLPELIDTAKITKLYVSEGNQVAKDQILCDIETAKVLLELRAPDASHVSKIVVNEGDILEADALIMSITPDAKLNHLVAPKLKSTHQLLSNEDITAEHEFKGKGNIDVQIDALPDFVDSATIIEIYVKEGDEVVCGDKLCDVYTDKAVLEVSAPHDGVVCDFVKKLEQTVTPDETIVTLYHPEYVASELEPELPEDNIDALMAQVLLDPVLDNEPSTLVELNASSHQATCDNLEAQEDVAEVEATDSTVIDTDLKNESPPLSTQTGDSYVDLTNDRVSPASTVLRSEPAVIDHVKEDCSKDSQEEDASSGKVFTLEDVAEVEATDSAVIDTDLKNESPSLGAHTDNSYVDLSNRHNGVSSVYQSESAITEPIAEKYNESEAVSPSFGGVFAVAAGIISIMLVGYFLLV